jgi:hypothetical protein
VGSLLGAIREVMEREDVTLEANGEEGDPGVIRQKDDCVEGES